MIGELNGKHCVVTGAGSGIGRAIAVDLAKRGALVAASDIDAGGLEETRALIGAGSNAHRFDALNVADAGAIEAYAADLGAHWGKADYLFNVAGLTRIGEFSETSLDAFEAVMDVNFRGVVRLTHAFLPQLIETKGGVVNISSLFGIIGVPGQSHYCASKFAVRGFSESIAQELAPHGVRVSCVHPGGVATNIANRATVDALPAGFETQEKVVKRSNKALRMPPENAAAIIINGAAKGKRRIMVGQDARALSFIQRLFPQSYQWLIAKLVRKEQVDVERLIH